jgi:hypothetical protein
LELVRADLQTVDRLTDLLLDHVPHPCDGIDAAERLFRARAPVGLVTLISVIMPPMTSMPTKMRPRFFSSGADAGADFRSRAESSVASAVPPTTRLERMAPEGGFRLIAPTGSPSTMRMRLSPSLTAGRKACAMKGSGTILLKRSTMDSRLPSSLAELEHPCPAMAVQRLQHDIAVTLAEFADAGDVARDQRCGLKIGEHQRQNFFGR